ncbi:MAG: DUF5606 domain-containing protein [Bacteroidetes bacterium]|nr:DUF5606 domain-containing protein [Bacteroidota bacterium]
MDLSNILAIAGKSGLFKVMSQTKNGVIVESLEDGKKIPVFANSRSSALEDISVFTVSEDLPLKEVFKKIFEKANGGKAVDSKADKNEMLKFFEEVLPEFDKERVYVSDIKKILSWYNLLLEKNLMVFEEEKPEKKTKAKAKAEGEVSEDKKEKAAKSAPKKESLTKQKSTAQGSKTLKAQPAKGGSSKNKGIGIKQK